jgi:hypothetical protein
LAADEKRVQTCAAQMDINEMASLCVSVENKGALASLVDES